MGFLTKLKQLDKCCCLPVRTGATVIAALGICLSALQLVGCLAGIGYVDNHVWYIRQRETFFATLTVSVVLAAVATTICSLLLVGIKKNNHKFMVPWIVMQIIGCCLQCLSIVAMLIVIFVFRYWMGILTVTFTKATIALSYYFLLVVNSEYQNIKRANTDTHIIMNDKLSDGDPPPPYAAFENELAKEGVATGETTTSAEQ